MYLYIDEYLMISFKRESSLMKIEWKSESTRLNEESFQSRINSIYYYFTMYEPKHVLTDCSHLVYRQFNGKEDFVLNRIWAEINGSEIDKFAIVNSTDKITRTLINRLVLNFQHERNGAKAFTNPLSAKSWILSEEKHLVTE